MYTDLLTKIRNAQAAKRETLKVSFSNPDFAVAELLAAKGYLASAAKKGRMPKRIIEIGLRYADGKGAIQGVRFLSRPSLRRYGGYREFRLVRQGYGLAVVSTSKGIMTAGEARKQKVGGQLLFEIW